MADLADFPFIPLSNIKKISKIGHGTYGVVYKCLPIRGDTFMAFKKFTEDFDDGIPFDVKIGRAHV